MDRATKLIVVVGACSAMAFEVWYVGLGRPLQQFTAAAFVGAAILAAIDRRAVSLVLAFSYVFPIIVWHVRGQFVAQFGIVWLAPLLGVMLPSALRTPWHIPSRWRPVLACWALTVLASGTIVAAREIDFHLPLLFVSRGMANSVVGGLPGEMTEWVIYVALVHLIGILWFDWLFGQRDLSPGWVAAPLALSACAMASVAAYQLFVDMTFWNRTLYGGMGRATGTMLDGNVCGTLAAMWIGAAVLWSRPLGRWAIPLQTLGMALGWVAVWATGSRTAFAAAVLITVFAVVDALAAGEGRLKRVAPRALLIGGVAMGAVLLLASAPLTEMNPVRRLSDITPGRSSFTTRDLLSELWNRNGLGAEAVDMIADNPLFGVGVGAFHIMAADYGAMYGGPRVFDNAQNWFRHQLAEFGIVGSLGWMAWVVAFASFVLAGRRGAPVPPGLWVGRGVLIAFGAISLVGMPGQHAAVVLTLWTMGFALVAVRGAPAERPVEKRAWIAVALVVSVFTVATALVAAHDLRVPMRAKRVGWPYSYGFHPVERGADPALRWTGDRAVAVVDAPTREIEFTVALNYGNYTLRPVEVRVWLDGQLVIEETVTSLKPVLKAVRVAGSSPRVTIESRVSRVFRPRDFGVDDQRELGVALSWRFAGAYE